MTSQKTVTMRAVSPSSSSLSFFFASVPFSRSPPPSLFRCHLLLFPVIILWICINQPLCMLVRLPGWLSPAWQFITPSCQLYGEGDCKCIQPIWWEGMKEEILSPPLSSQSLSLFPQFFGGGFLRSFSRFCSQLRRKPASTGNPPSIRDKVSRILTVLCFC